MSCLDLHIEPTQIRQFAGFLFGGFFAISFQNDATSAVAGWIVPNGSDDTVYLVADGLARDRL